MRRAEFVGYLLAVAIPLYIASVVMTISGRSVARDAVLTLVAILLVTAILTIFGEEFE